MLEKACFKCGERKPLFDFYRHPQMGDGHLNKCKTCTKSDAWHHRHRHHDRVRAYDRERSKQPHRQTEAVRRAAEYRQRYPERYAANTAVANALRDGKLQKLPCLLCGELDVEAHHPDYSAPLLVVWLCVLHHRELHLAYPDGHYHETT